VKLRTEAPVNGGRNYNGPKVRFASLSKIWLYAGKSEYPSLRKPWKGTTLVVPSGGQDLEGFSP
jgi:hypothetical protein